MDPVRGILHWPSAAGHFLSQKAFPAVFGNDPSVGPPDRGNPLADALAAAGTAMAVSAGGPRRFGEFAPSPIASVLQGLQVGREVYQGAQTEQRRRQAYRANTMPTEGPTLPFLTQQLQTAIDQGDLPAAREFSTIIGNHAYVQPGSGMDPLTQARIELLNAQRDNLTGLKPGRSVVLGPGQRLVNDRGEIVAEGPPRPAGPPKLTPAVAMETDAAIGTLRSAFDDMRRSFMANSSNAQPPTLGQTAIGAIAGRLGGPELENAAYQQMLRPGQATYRAAGQQFLHTASSLMAKGGRSVALLNSLNQAYQAANAQDDPAVWASFLNRAEGLVQDFERSVAANPVVRNPTSRRPAPPDARPAAPAAHTNRFFQ